MENYRQGMASSTIGQYDIFTTVYHCRIFDKGYIVKVQRKNDVKCQAAPWLAQKK